MPHRVLTLNTIAQPGDTQMTNMCGAQPQRIYIVTEKHASQEALHHNVVSVTKAENKYIPPVV